MRPDKNREINKALSVPVGSGQGEVQERVSCSILLVTGTEISWVPPSLACSTECKAATGTTATAKDVHLDMAI